MRKPVSPQKRKKDHKSHRYSFGLNHSFLSALCLLCSVLCFCGETGFFIPSINSHATAQRRPVLRPPARDFFAGKFVLITRDERPQSLHQPRMLARVADHDLIAPPARVMTGADALIEWVKNVDYDNADGVIVSLVALSGGS